MQSFQRKVTFASTTKNLPAVLAFIEEACAAAGVAPALWFDVQLAVEEACSNIIEHAYREAEGDFSLAFAAQDTDVIITLHDHGRPFDPQAVARPAMNRPLKKRPVGGLGLHLIYQLMDEVRFTFEASGNTLVLVKRNAIPGASHPCAEKVSDARAEADC